MHQQYKLLSTVCKLYDGENYVTEERIRRAWPKCPSHAAILNLAGEEYLSSNSDLKNPGYIPTPACLLAVHEHQRNTLILVVAVLTLAATIFFGIFQ